MLECFNIEMESVEAEMKSFHKDLFPINLHSQFLDVNEDMRQI